MIAGNEAVKSGKIQERQIRLHLEALGFVCSSTADGDNKARKEHGGTPDRFARQGQQYVSPERPNTKAKSDWTLFVEGRQELHIESKNQLGGGSVAAKAVTAAFELGSVREAFAVNCYLVLPTADTLDRLSPCDADYFRWAYRVAKQSGIYVGDLSQLCEFLTVTYRRVVKWGGV